jgi:hypothetical protein
MNYSLTGKDDNNFVMIKSFKSDIYPIEIVFCIGKTIEEISDYCYKKFESKKFLLEELEPLRESAGFCYDGGRGTLIISVKNVNTPHFIGILSHEISHATFFICDRLGIDTKTSPQEAYCYLNGWITEKIWGLIEKDIAKK